MTQILSKTFHQGCERHVALRDDAAQIAEIFTAEEWNLIKKYLPNYSMREEFSALETVSYLSANLRNILRGHGSFDRNDGNTLFAVLFKLAILNTVYLQTDMLMIRHLPEPIWSGAALETACACAPGDPEKMLSPFLAYTAEGSLLVFNNWYSDRDKNKGVEYINYLDGSLVLPTFRRIDVDS